MHKLHYTTVMYKAVPYLIHKYFRHVHCNLVLHFILYNADIAVTYTTAIYTAVKYNVQFTAVVNIEV